MINKRFVKMDFNTVGLDDAIAIYDQQMHNIMISVEEIVDLLNEISEKNKELKKDNELFSIKIKEVFEENEQLKELLEAVREELSLADRDNTLLEEENEKLKMLVQRRIMR